ncbi:UNVERIFIED_CONTAM: zinc transport system permease protein [Acetivibrio alkalicellulosi]
MLEIFQYPFMQRAFIVGILIGVIIPLIGMIMVLKRLSMIGDALSHTALAGVAAGLAFNINPIFAAIIFSVFSALGIEKIRKAIPKYGEIAIAVVMSTGIGLAAILSDYVKNANFHSFLFGSIVVITNFELILVVGLSFIVLLTLSLLYKELFYITFDEESARLAGIPVAIIRFIFTLLTAITVSVSSRIVGTLVISSMIVLPVATAMQIGKSYWQTTVLSVIISVTTIVLGLFISFYSDFKPGGTIVIINVICLIISLIRFKKQ